MERVTPPPPSRKTADGLGSGNPIGDHPSHAFGWQRDRPDLACQGVSQVQGGDMVGSGAFSAS
jgi:hypothetical protein